MSIKELSDQNSDYMFSTQIAVRMDDLAGGLHVGNHLLVAYITEAQMRLMKALGFPTLTVEGAIPMNQQLEIAFFSESRYGDVIEIFVAVDNIEINKYQLNFLLINQASEKVVSKATMSMVFFNLEHQQRVDVPTSFISACQSLVK